MKKHKKLPSIPRINRKLFKLWSEKIRARANNQCEYCGIAKGAIGKNGKPVKKLDAHHFISRVKKDSFLKWSLHNGICLCPTCHKFGEDYDICDKMIKRGWKVLCDTSVAFESFHIQQPRLIDRAENYLKGGAIDYA